MKTQQSQQDSAQELAVGFPLWNFGLLRSNCSANSAPPRQNILPLPKKDLLAQEFHQATLCQISAKLHDVLASEQRYKSNAYWSLPLVRNLDIEKMSSANGDHSLEFLPVILQNSMAVAVAGPPRSAHDSEVMLRDAEVSTVPSGTSMPSGLSYRA